MFDGLMKGILAMMKDFLDLIQKSHCVAITGWGNEVKYKKALCFLACDLV